MDTINNISDKDDNMIILKKRYNEYINKLDEKIKHLNHFMNNTKWNKLFETLLENNIIHIKIKYLMDYPEETKFILKDNSFNEIGFEDNYVCGPTLYKEIEWIEILEKTEKINGARIIKTTKDEIKEIINGIGKFEYEKTLNGIKIYGYK
jgi:hypothetical protein